MSSSIPDFDKFVELHGLLLASAGIPASLHRRLFHKLTCETFDGGDFFRIEPCDGGRKRQLVLAAESMAKESDVFLVDHAWTFRMPDARKQLQEVPGLVERMAVLMCVYDDVSSDGEGDDEGGETGVKASAAEIVEMGLKRVQEQGDRVPVWLELEELDIDDDMLLSLELSAKFPNLVALNLWGNKLHSADVVVQEISKCQNLKALWLNENPVASGGNQILEAILQSISGLEIYNSHFMECFSHWALGFCGRIYGIENPCSSEFDIHPLKDITNLNLSDRHIDRLSDKIFCPQEIPMLSSLNLRGNPLDENTADDLLRNLQGFTKLHSLEVDIPGPLGKSAVDIIESLPNLELLNGVKAASILESRKHVIDTVIQPRLPSWDSGESLVERVMSAMWLYMMTYRLADEEKIDETSVWYVMDEFGSTLGHSDEPNFRVAPFLFMPEGNLASAISFSLLWPIQNVIKGDECTRDFLFGIGEDKQRSARLTAWFHTPENYFIEEYEKFKCHLNSNKCCALSVENSSSQRVRPKDGRSLFVYTDIPHIEEYLKRPEFVLTTDPKEADIIWTSMQIDEEVKKAIGLTDKHYINQFPFEACLVMKHHLAETIHKAQGSPDWLQPTYNLETQLAVLIGDYCVRKRDGLNNLWILKPWNMARTIDTTVTGDLSAIVRLMETGPKICQKYIEHPALFKGKKFDLRYTVLVRSISPLEIFLADVFWARLANNPYSLDKTSLFEYETHFTVMNYIGRLNHMNTHEFVEDFEKEHNVKWMDIHQRIRHMLRSVFESAAASQPEMHNSTSRAMYGVDVMLDSSFHPKLLEVTYCPDCSRACKYDVRNVVRGRSEVVKASEFFNHVFGCLFLNETDHVAPL